MMDGGGGGGSEAVGEVRKDFPETWMWLYDMAL